MRGPDELCRFVLEDGERTFVMRGQGDDVVTVGDDEEADRSRAIWASSSHPCQSRLTARPAWESGPRLSSARPRSRYRSQVLDASKQGLDGFSSEFASDYATWACRQTSGAIGVRRGSGSGG